MKHMLSSALLAGLVTGLLCALLQYLLVEPDILLAERYETGELTHFAAPADHDHATAPADPAAEAGQDHPASNVEPSPLQRQALTVLFSVLTYCGYALVLLGGIRLAEASDITIGPAQGLLWGLAGFLTFQLMPALGLAPELPGTPAVDLSARQYWWAATAAATAVGLWFAAYGTALWQRLAGAGVLAAPHLWGAPEPETFGGIVPPELAASFAAHSLGVGLITWVVLGGVLVAFWHSEPAP